MSEPPPSFDADFSSDWSEWVLAHGLPNPPLTVARGQSIPVARWVGTEWGVVMHLDWSWAEDDPEDEPYVATEVEVWKRIDGVWQVPGGSGGTNWHTDGAITRLDLPERTVHLGGRGQNPGLDSDWAGGFIDGYGGSASTSVTVQAEGRSETCVIDNDLGIVLAAFDATKPAVVTVTDTAGVVLATDTWQPFR